MELVVFDLDGTLLDKDSSISEFTRDTLHRLSERKIAYTVATGRTLHASRDILSGHQFNLPQIYKNGVVIWHPQQQKYSHRNLLTHDEVSHIMRALMSCRITPFIFTLDADGGQSVYHYPLQSDIERRLVEVLLKERGQRVLEQKDLPGGTEISHVSAIGPAEHIAMVQHLVDSEEHLVCYTGDTKNRENLSWIDIHHSDASKGGAVQLLKESLGARRVVCFGDSDNDLSMFALADECYAPANAKDSVKAIATAVIGHHDEDGIAQFLRERFAL